MSTFMIYAVGIVIETCREKIMGYLYRKAVWEKIIGYGGAIFDFRK